MPKLEYPVYFENGLKGMRCKEDIEHREVFLFVPYRMMFTIEATQNIEALKPIIEAHPKAFKKEENELWAHTTLTLNLMYQISLGKQSYWYPYLR